MCDRCGGTVIVRDDDKPEAVVNRMKVYEEFTAPVLSYYRSRGDVIEIDGAGTPDEVFEALSEAVSTDARSN